VHSQRCTPGSEEGARKPTRRESGTAPGAYPHGCSIELHADGPRFLDRRGRQILDAPPPSRPPDLGWEAILARHAELQITASANEPLWDGARVDHGAVIDALVGVEQAEAIQGLGMTASG